MALTAEQFHQKLIRVQLQMYLERFAITRKPSHAATFVRCWRHYSQQGGTP
jgi:hypothetical protein